MRTSISHPPCAPHGPAPASAAVTQASSLLPPQGLYPGYSFGHGHCSPHLLTSSLSCDSGLSSCVSQPTQRCLSCPLPHPCGQSPAPSRHLIFLMYILRALPTALNYLVYSSASCFSLCLCPLECHLLLPAVSLGWTQGLPCRRGSVTTLARE